MGTLGFRYKDTALANGLVRTAQIKKTPSGTFVLKAIVMDPAIFPGGPTTSYATNFTLGTGDQYCGGTAGAVPNPNNGTTFKVSNDGAPAGCVVSCTPTTTSSTSSSTSTTSTTSTTILPPCCNGDSFVSFTNVNAPGDCGDVIDAVGMLVTNIQCAGLYTGGGGNSIPLPLAVPDLGQTVSAITQCTGQTAILGATTSDETGSNRNCTSTGCLLGAPLAVPNSMSIPTSVCVTNTASQPLTGTAVCDTGFTEVVLPLSSQIFLTGDSLGTVTGIQPCPICSGGTCIGGPNNGMACVAGTTAINASYPTSHDCPPEPSNSIGSLPIAVSLTTGSLSWRATPATNDTGSTASFQVRVFSGFCRDTDLPGGTGSFDADVMAGDQFKQCWENGMAVGTPCSEADNGAESCEQRTNGAFGPNGGATRTIIAIGSATSILGGPAPGVLVSVFSIPPTLYATIDSAYDLPGPGAVAVPGTRQTCVVANPCP